MGLPNEEIAIFPQQGEPQAEVDAILLPMETIDTHLGAPLAAEGPRTPSPTAEEEDGNEEFKSSPPLDSQR